MVIPTDLDSLTDVTISAPASNELLKYNGSQWVNSSDYLSMRSLNDLGDVNISGVSDAQLLTYQNISSQWVNQSKPTYSIQEQTDFDSSITKNDLDYMAWNASTSKWEPLSVSAEVLNVFNAYSTTETITLVNVGGFIPLFSAVSGYVVENLGDAFTVVSSTNLRFN